MRAVEELGGRARIFCKSHNNLFFGNQNEETKIKIEKSLLEMGFSVESFFVKQLIC